MLTERPGNNPVARRTINVSGSAERSNNLANAIHGALEKLSKHDMNVYAEQQLQRKSEFLGTCHFLTSGTNI